MKFHFGELGIQFNLRCIDLVITVGFPEIGPSRRRGSKEAIQQMVVLTSITGLSWFDNRVNFASLLV